MTMTKAELSDAERVTRHFCKESGYGLKDVPPSWAALAQSLLNTTGFELKEAGEFITWAVSENISENPKYNSVAYIAAAKDKFATLMKNSEALLRSFNRRNVVSTKVAAAKTKKERPLPLGIAKWLMVGPGVNQPLNGWTSAREKMDSVKRAWYGKGGEQQPDPQGINIDAAFEEYLASRIRKENHG